MNDLVAREFDVADFIRRVTNASGDGRISASISTRNTGNVKWAIESLRQFAGRLRDSNSNQVLNGYLSISPAAAELFYPLWAVEFSSQMTSLALDCLFSAIKRREELAKFAVKQHAAALIHVLNHDRKYLARKVYLLLKLCTTSKVLSSTMTRRFGASILSDAKYVKIISSQHSVPRIAFIEFVTNLLQSNDNDSIRFLTSSSRHCLVSTAGIALSALQESLQNNNSEDVNTYVHPSFDGATEPPEKKQKREQAHLRKTALNAARDYLDAIKQLLNTCKNNFLLRSAFEPPFIDKIASIACITSNKKKKRLTQNESTRAEACETARSILMTVAEYQPRICRPYHIARALGDIFRDTPYTTSYTTSSSASFTFAHQLISNVLERIPQLSAELLRCGPFLTFQPESTSTWLSNASVILTCTRYLSDIPHVFQKFSFFERTLNHTSPLVKHIALLILHKLCTLDNVTSEDLPAFALFYKNVSKLDKWDDSVQEIFATYRKVQPKLFVDSAKGTDPIKLAVTKTDSNMGIALASPTIRVCLESSTQETLDTIFKKKVLSNLIITKPTSPLIHDIIIATELFPTNTTMEMEISVWIAFLKNQGEECVLEFESLVAKSWRQPFALFDDAYERNASLFSVAAARKISKIITMNGGDDMKAFDSYLMDVLAALQARDIIMGKKKQHCTKSLFSCSIKGLHSILTDDGDSVERAVEFLREKTGNTNAKTGILSEVVAVGAFLADLYKFRKVKKQNADVGGDEKVLDRIWNSYCASSNTTSRVAFDEQFFRFHATKLGVLNVDSNSSYAEKTIFGFIYLLCTADNNSVSARQFPHEERAVMTRLNLGKTNSLEIVVDALECIEENTQVLPMFGTSIRGAIINSRNDGNEIVSRILKHVFSIIKKTLKKSSSEQNIMRECAEFVLGIFDAFLTHESEQIRDRFTALIAKMTGDKKKSGNFARLASHAVQPYIELLQKNAVFTEGAAEYVNDMVLQENGASAYERPECFMPLLAFLASRSDKIGANVAKISLSRPWKSNNNNNNSNSNSGNEVEEAAFALGVSIGSCLNTLDNILDTLMEIGPPDEKSSASIWWEIACGVMSTSTPSSSESLIEEGCTSIEKARKLIQMIASQISSEDNMGGGIYHGPVEFLRHILPHAQLPIGRNTIQRGSAEFEFADNLCTFFTALFKSTTPQLMRAISDHVSDGEGIGDHNNNGREEAKKHRALDELAIVLQCVDFGISIPELGLNLARFVLSTFGENLYVFLAVGSHSSTAININRASRKSRESVLDVFMDITVKTTAILRNVGMDSRSATAMTKLEQLFSNPDFTFFASISKFDRKVIASMSNIKHAMAKEEFRKYKGLPDYRCGLFSGLAANVVPLLKAERLFATAKWLTGCIDDKRFETRIFPVDMDVDAGMDMDIEMETVPYDPAWALKTLRLACEYAIYTKEATVLDFNLVVNGGLLRVALAGIACDKEDVRVAAYAALDALSRALGPEFVPNSGNTNESNPNNIPLGQDSIGNGLDNMKNNNKNNKRPREAGPANLYVNRRQLAFLLQVLQDSIDEPLVQVLPLFSAWLWQVIRVLLKASHRAHVPVMRYLLRLPRFDVEDCVGIVHLLRSSDAGTDTAALRMLALECIEEGLVSKKDHLVAKKRNLYTSIMLLTGSDIADTNIRDKAVSVLGSLAGRLKSGGVAIQLVAQHSFAEAMVPQVTDATERRIHHVMLRIRALKNVAVALPENFDTSVHAKTLGHALKCLITVAHGIIILIPGVKLERKERNVAQMAVVAVRSRGGNVALDAATEKWMMGAEGKAEY